MYIQSGELVTILRLKKIYKSLGVRIFLILLIMGVVPVSIVKLWITADYNDSIYKQRENRILYQCNMLVNSICNSDYLTANVNNSVNVELEQLTTNYNGRILILNSDCKVIKDTYYLDEGKTGLSKNVIKAVNGKKIVENNKESGFLQVTAPVFSNDSTEVNAIVVAIFSTDDIKSLVEDSNRRAWIILLIVYVLIAGGGVLFAIIVIRPMKKMENAIDEIAKGHSDDEISEEGYTYTELAGIAKAYNHSVGRMQQLDMSRQEFVSNVAHELKTPMASIKVLSDSLLCQEDIPAELYREFLGDIVKEIDRESDIINDLLSLVHLDNNTSQINVENQNINELLELILKRLRPLAAKENIELVLESFRPVNADIDQVQFTMALQNLVENAIKYNKLEGWVRVSLNADHKYFYIKVSDSGVGIPEDELNNVFERFYRVDKARSRETGGTGLGLAITQKIIRSHKGEIKLYSKLGEGSTFNIRIPLNYKK